MAERKINAETSQKDLELYVMKGAHTSGSKELEAAARAKAELWRRDREAERVLAAKQLEIANSHLETAERQAKSARRAVWAAWASAFAAFCLLIITAISIFSSTWSL